MKKEKLNNLKTENLISVIMITYGHENYLKQAIEGVLMQVCDYRIELIVSDDESPDKTEEVVLDLIKNHENGQWIKYTRHKNNKGLISNFQWAINQGKGKYIAICEGDDYWTNPHKLQKQIDFLEANEDYALSCHNALKLYMGAEKEKELFTNLKENTDISLDQIVNSWIMPTGSFVFRKELITPLPEWYSKIYSGDLSLALILRHSGKVYFFSEAMSIYRINLIGSSASATYGKSLLFVRRQHKLLFEYYNEWTNFKYNQLIISKLKKLQKEIKFLELKEQGVNKAILKMPITSIKRIISSLLYKFKMK